MGKRTKHPHAQHVMLCAHAQKSTHSTLHLCLWISLSLLARCMQPTHYTIVFLLCESPPVPFTTYCLCVCYAGNICVFRVPLILPSRGYMRGGSSVCQHGASLTSWVLLKVLMEERLRGLCPLEPSCASVSPLLSACSLFLVCLYWQLGGGQWTFR